MQPWRPLETCPRDAPGRSPAPTHPEVSVPEPRLAPSLESDTVRLSAHRPVDGPTTKLAGAALVLRMRTRTAWSVWAVTFAVGVVVFEWQAVVPLLSTHTLNGVIACFVLLRPSAVWRSALLYAGLGAEFLLLLPNPYSAALLAHLSALALAVWFGVRLLRHRTLHADRGEVFERVAPFLRCGFLVAWFTDAVSKLNSDFIASLGTCAPNVLDDVPMFHVPQSLYAPIAVVTVVLEFAIPTLLLLRPTRAVGVVLATLWYALIAAGGNPANAALMFAFVILFLPGPLLASSAARLRVLGRRLALPDLRAFARSPFAPVALAAVWLVGLSVAAVLPFELSVRLSRWSAIALTVAWLAVWARLMLRQHRQWLTGGDLSTTLRIREGVLLAAMAVLLLNSASPYLGLKTDWSFSQYGNLRTEAGHWNHLVIPEAVRVFHSQDHLVRLVHAQGDNELLELVDHNAGSRFTLVDAKRLLSDYPSATLDYELDGTLQHTEAIGDDPVIGGGVAWYVDLLGRYRRIPLAPHCQF